MRAASPHAGWIAIAIASAAFACSQPGHARSGQARDEVIYGEDTRRDVYAEDSDLLRRLALQGSVAFITADHLARASDGSFAVVSETLGEANNLCPGEAFAAQPAAATCSGVLVDDQLVLTAGHCVDEGGRCDERLLVFGFAITDPDHAPILDEDAIYRCKSIPLHRYGVDPSGGRHDFAFVELDRPVSSARQPVAISPADPDPGDALAVIGYPSGVPVKIDGGAELLEMSACRDYFTLSSDTFQASSGSGVFDDTGRLAGVFVRGGADYEYVSDRGCAVARRIVDVVDPTSAEQASTMGPAIDALCASGWQSTRLCSAAGEPARNGDQATGACPAEPGELALAGGGCTIDRPADRRDRSRPDAMAAIIAVLLALRVRSRRAVAPAVKHARFRA